MPSPTPTRRPSPDLAGGRCFFYDLWEAFPSAKRFARPGLTGELVVRLTQPDSDDSEFTIGFHAFSNGDESAVLQVHGDTWQAFARSGLLDVFASLDGQPQRLTDIRRVLENVGLVDKTRDLRDDHIAAIRAFVDDTAVLS